MRAAILGMAATIALTGCNRQWLAGTPARPGCGDSTTLSAVAANQTVDSIRKITLERAATNPRRTVQANLVADYGRGPSGRRSQSDVSAIAKVDGSFARMNVTAQAAAPVADVLLDGDRFSVVSHLERRVLQGGKLERGSDRAPFVPLARAMVQVLDPQSALAARFARQPRPAMERRAGEYVLTFNRPDGLQEAWTLRQRDLMPLKLVVLENGAPTSEITVTGYKDSSDGSGPVPTCANLLVDPGVDVGLRSGTLRRNVVIPAASRRQERPAGYRVQNI